MSIEELYEQRWKRPFDSPNQDIYEHLPVIRKYAQKVKHITEIGTRTGNSTTGLLAGLSSSGGEMHSFDKAPQAYAPPEIPHVKWIFHQQDVHQSGFQIFPTELLFIDGDHSYDSVAKDLTQAKFVSRFIIMHDTSEERDAKIGDGVCKALYEFIRAHPQWIIMERYPNCNGLTVLEKKT